MEEILQQYPAPSDEKKMIFLSSYSPDFVMDLHGYTKDQSDKKLEWIQSNRIYKQWQKVRIITGKGSGVLFDHVRKKIRSQYFHQTSWQVLENSSGFDIFW